MQFTNIDRLHKVHFQYPQIWERKTGHTFYCLHIIAGLLSIADTEDPKTITLVLQNYGAIDKVVDLLVVLLAVEYGFQDISYDKQTMWFGDRKATVRIISLTHFNERRFGILGSRGSDEYVFDIHDSKVTTLISNIAGKREQNTGLLQDKGLQNTLVLSELYRL